MTRFERTNDVVWDWGERNILCVCVAEAGELGRESSGWVGIETDIFLTL